MRFHLVVAAAVLSLVVALSGCGNPTSVEDLYERMWTATETASTVRIVGTLPLDGQPAEVDLTGTQDGSNQILTITQDGRGTATFVMVDGKEYLKADQAYYTAIGEPETGDLAGGRYVLRGGPRMSADVNAGAILDDLMADPLLDTSTRLQERELDGRPAYLLTDRVGSDETEIWVSSAGDAHLLKIVTSQQGQPVNVAFSEWNAVEPITAPAPDEVMT